MMSKRRFMNDPKNPSPYDAPELYDMIAWAFKG
jgi:hypothetical protein